MADPNMNKTPEEMKKNETMQREQQTKSDFEKKSQPEKGSADKEREEKSAIGGGQTGPSGQSGQSPTGQQSGQQFDKNRSEPTNR